MALTNRQKALLGLLNQMSENLSADGQNVSVLPGIDFNIGCKDPDTTPPSTPTTFREVLLDLVNEQVQVTTPFGAVTGTLIMVKNDYIVIIEASLDQVLVRIDKIELISEL